MDAALSTYLVNIRTYSMQHLLARQLANFASQVCLKYYEIWRGLRVTRYYILNLIILTFSKNFLSRHSRYSLKLFCYTKTKTQSLSKLVSLLWKVASHSSFGKYRIVFHKEASDNLPKLWSCFWISLCSRNVSLCDIWCFILFYNFSRQLNFSEI